MYHKTSQFTFQSKEIEWKVLYYYIQDKYGYDRLTAKVFENNELYHDFENNLPYTKTNNPTKTQAKEIITAAKKLNKERDKRNKNIEKIIN